MFSLESLKAFLISFRLEQKKLVFTNGCFDLMHRGHLSYLKEARSLGDFLIVGLNSDLSIRSLKGPLRPIFSQDDRAYFLESLRFVDGVVLFDEETPCHLIKDIQPDIYVKGGDYDLSTLPEAPIVQSYGGVVKILSFISGYSSSAVIQKIQSL